jgi:hypothetical protein
MTHSATLRDHGMRAFISSLSQLEASAPTWCSGWGAHELAAHVTAAAAERADLIEEYLAGKSTRPTRPWEVREPPFRGMPDAVLRKQLAYQAIRFESTVAALQEDDIVTYTGWRMTAQRLRMHSHSEAVLHRWDLVGDDELSVRLLSNTAMVTHALAAFGALPALAEARRWHDGHVISRPLTLRSGHGPNVVVTPGKGLSTTSSDAGVVVELAPYEVPLVLWGRCPSRLRDPAAGAETLDEVLRRLCNDE